MVYMLKESEDVMNAPVAIIGAGPAGLAAAQPLLESGIKFFLIDQGDISANRDRRDPKNVIEGVGGSGLFSDGKFSFYPSATNLWKLSPAKPLLNAFNWLISLLTDHAVITKKQQFPDLDANPQRFSHKLDGTVSQKLYDSIKSTIPQRMAIIETLWNLVASSTILRTRLINISQPDSNLIKLSLVRNTSGASSSYQVSTLYCNYLILAGGRYSSIMLRDILPTNLFSFRRWEFGFRVEQQAQTFFLNSTNQLDPKFIWKSIVNNLEYRTFCCCRDGEVITTNSYGLLSVSGRSNSDPTGRSNVGFLLRSTDKMLGKAFSTFLSQASSLTQPIIVTLEEVISDGIINPSGLYRFRRLFGNKISQLLLEGISSLTSMYPDLVQNGATLHMPAIEGIGYYPKFSSDLRIPGTNIWVCGDACGTFRGLTAAFISGYFAGKIILNIIENEHE